MKLSDFNNDTPSVSLDETARHSVGRSARVKAFHPVAASTPRQLSDRAKQYRHRHDQGKRIVTGTASIALLDVGMVMRCSDDPDDAWVVTRCQRRFLSVSHEAGFAASSAVKPASHLVSFTAQDASYSFLPAMLSAPLQYGVHNAVVCGGLADDIVVDSRGRVPLRWCWEDDTATTATWVQVAQDWAGEGSGAEFLPRVGHEVLVKYKHGDINHPVVVGSVYNAAHSPPLDLPAAASCTGYFLNTVGEQAKRSSAVYFDSTTNRERVVLDTAGQREDKVGNDSLAHVEGDDVYAVARGSITDIAKGRGELAAAHGLTLAAGNSVLRMTSAGIALSADQITINE